MTAQTETFPKKSILNQPYKAGFWLIAMLPIAIVIVYPLTTRWIHRQDIAEMVGIPLLAVIFGGTAYMWANALVRRSGWEASWRTGLAGTLGITVTIMGVYAGFEPVFEFILDAVSYTHLTLPTNREV